MRTYYEILQVTTDAGEEVIRAAYKQLAQKWHPDRNSHRLAEAEERMREINEAYEVLSDPVRRRAYDDAHAAAGARSDSWIGEREASMINEVAGHRTRWIVFSALLGAVIVLAGRVDKGTFTPGVGVLLYFAVAIGGEWLSAKKVFPYVRSKVAALGPVALQMTYDKMMSLRLLHMAGRAAVLLVSFAIAWQSIFSPYFNDGEEAVSAGPAAGRAESADVRPDLGGGFTQLLSGDVKNGVQSLEAESKRGSGTASYQLARLNFIGFGVPRDRARARQLAERAVEQGSSMAMSMLSTWLANGEGGPKEPERALQLASRALEEDTVMRGVRLARLGGLYWSGASGKPDHETALGYYRQALDAGYLRAAEALALDAEDNKRYSEAVPYWLQAAEAGSVYAQAKVGEAYLNGRGVPQDTTRGRYWVLRAARAGDGPAAVTMSYRYATDSVFGRDDKASLDWALRAAFRGQPTGMFNAGASLERLGNESARALAYIFYNLAAANGYEPAVKVRDAVAQRLPVNVLREAQQDASAFNEAKNELLVEGGSGTGFFVDVGLIATNEHVIGECVKAGVELPDGRSFDAQVVAADADLDLALLSLDSGSNAAATAAVAMMAPNEPQLGERVTAFGYPLSGLLATSGNLTTGTVTATAGLKNDRSRLQFSAPVQKGNSGGALLDERGQVVGVVQAVLSPLAQGQDVFVPQNVNFAIKSDALKRLVQASGYFTYQMNNPQPMDTKALGVAGRAISVRVRCDTTVFHEGLGR